MANKENFEGKVNNNFKGVCKGAYRLLFPTAIPNTQNSISGRWRAAGYTKFKHSFRHWLSANSERRQRFIHSPLPNNTHSVIFVPLHFRFYAKMNGFGESVWILIKPASNLIHVAPSCLAFPVCFYERKTQLFEKIIHMVACILWSKLPVGNLDCSHENRARTKTVKTRGNSCSRGNRSTTVYSSPKSWENKDWRIWRLTKEGKRSLEGAKQDIYTILKKSRKIQHQQRNTNKINVKVIKENVET